MYINKNLILKPIEPKKRCICCRRTGIKISKEHIFPQWLIKKTNTNNTSIRWINNRIPASAATIPICSDCNREFGEKLENPVSKIFEDLEDGKGISDNEAELMVRWMWKTEGLSWCFSHHYIDYTHTYNLKERALYPINQIRGQIVIAVSLIKRIEDYFGDSPMGFDSSNAVDCVFSSGVFSKIAVIVTLDCFVNEILTVYDIYSLFSKREKFGNLKTFFPKTGFLTCSQAVYVTKTLSDRLSKLHDDLVLKLKKSEYENMPRILKDYRI